MIDPNLSHDSPDTLAAAAFAKSRLVAKAIREDVLHNLKPLERTGPTRLLEAIDRRKIFDGATLSEIEFLAGKLERLIDEGTTEIELWDPSPENQSETTVWTECRRTPQAQDLCGALTPLLDLRETLLAVHDLVHAERVIFELRQAH